MYVKYLYCYILKFDLGLVRIWTQTPDIGRPECWPLVRLVYWNKPIESAAGNTYGGKTYLEGTLVKHNRLLKN